MEEKELNITFTHLLLSFGGILLLCGALKTATWNQLLF